MKWWIQICCQYVQMRWGERYDSDCLQPTSETCLKLCHGLKLHFNQWCSWKDDWRKALLDIDPPWSTILSGWAGDHMLCGCKAVGLGLSPTCCTLSCPLSPSLLSCLYTLSLLNKGQKLIKLIKWLLLMYIQILLYSICLKKKVRIVRMSSGS